MQRPTYAMMVFTVVLAVLLGVIGGGVVGGFAGYYAAQSALPAPVDAASASVANASPNPNLPLLQAAPPANTNLTLKEDSAVIDTVKKAEPAVVTVINNLQSQSGSTSRGTNPFGPNPNSSPSVAEGSGVIIDSQGHIITNAHVVRGALAGQGVDDGLHRPARGAVVLLRVVYDDYVPRGQGAGDLGRLGNAQLVQIGEELRHQQRGRVLHLFDELPEQHFVGIGFRDEAQRLPPGNGAQGQSAFGLNLAFNDVCYRYGSVSDQVEIPPPFGGKP